MHCEMEGARKARRVPAPSLSVALYVCLESVASRGQDVHHAGAAVRGEQGIGIDSQHIMHARLYPAAAGCVSCTSYSSFRLPRLHAFSQGRRSNSFGGVNCKRPFLRHTKWSLADSVLPLRASDINQSLSPDFARRSLTVLPCDRVPPLYRGTTAR
jgi:hypothetical protein